MNKINQKSRILLDSEQSSSNYCLSSCNCIDLKLSESLTLSWGTFLYGKYFNTLSWTSYKFEVFISDRWSDCERKWLDSVQTSIDTVSVRFCKERKNEECLEKC